MKTKKLGLLALFLTAFQLPFWANAQSPMGIALTNNQAVLFWRNSNGTNAILQSSTDIASPNWVSATDSIPFNYGSQLAVTVSNSPVERFFRLLMMPPTADGMALIPAGTFTIGDSLDGESDAIPTNVFVSGFYMETNLVNSNLWRTVYAYAISHGYAFDDPYYYTDGTNNPISADWFDCAKWCNARSQMAGLTPMYYTDTNFLQVYTNSQYYLSVTNVNWLANGYRLPTEAEWEKAARGGLSELRFPWGDTIDESEANYLGDTNLYSYDLGPNGYNPLSDGGFHTSPVGSFAPNGYGLYDMAGNLLEWCWDLYGGEPYATGSPYLGGVDPHGLVSNSPGHVLRSGNSWYRANYARCANRDFSAPINDSIGFRCVRRQ